MKHLISSLVLLVTFATSMVTFTACTDNDVPDLVTYNASEVLGNWVSEYNRDGSVAIVSITKTFGDTICSFSITDTTGVVVNCTDGTFKYDQASGMSIIDFPSVTSGYKENGTSLPVRVYLARQADSNRMIVKVEADYTALGYSGYEQIMSYYAIPSQGGNIKGNTYESSEQNLYVMFETDSTATIQMGAYYDDEAPFYDASYSYSYVTGQGTMIINNENNDTLNISYGKDNNLIVISDPKNNKTYEMHPVWMD